VELRQNLHSVILWEKQNLWSKSEAILTALRRIQYAPDLVFMAGLAPRGLLNFIYDWIARNRRRWFGTASDICPLLPVEQQRQILN
jgi:predicted DCC family thiol-disulfide oxidoreductase YuxK